MLGNVLLCGPDSTLRLLLLLRQLPPSHSHLVAAEGLHVLEGTRSDTIKHLQSQKVH